MIMIENGKQVRPAPAADTLRGQHVQSALSEDEKGESILNLDYILQDVGLMYINIIHKVKSMSGS